MTPAAGGTVSVVVPTRNRGELLFAAIQSALEVGASAVIVVDGGSRDGSIERLRALGDRVHVLRGTFRNAAATRNAGAAAARSDYLAFLDSDDLMLPEKVTCLAEILDEDPAVALAHGRLVVIDEDGLEDEAGTAAAEAALRRADEIGTSYVDLARNCVMFTSATLMRRSAFLEIGGYDESLEVYEDWDLYLRLALHWRLVYVPCVVAHYRVWSGNVRWDKTAAGVIRVAEKHLASPPTLSPRDAAAARYAFLRRIVQSSHILLDGGSTRRAAAAAVRERPLLALADPAVVGPALRSLVPARLLRGRRPPLARP